MKKLGEAIIASSEVKILTIKFKLSDISHRCMLYSKSLKTSIRTEQN